MRPKRGVPLATTLAFAPTSIRVPRLPHAVSVPAAPYWRSRSPPWTVASLATYFVFHVLARPAAGRCPAWVMIVEYGAVGARFAWMMMRDAIVVDRDRLVA